MVLVAAIALSALLWPAMGPDSQAEPFVRPEFAQQIETLRPAILDAAARHNRPKLSGMSDEQFAVAIAQILYNEHFGWLEQELPPLRGLTPWYQATQIMLNGTTGTNFTVWPSNIRPSVAAEILRGEVPLPGSPYTIVIPIRIHGSQIDLDHFPDQRAAYAALNSEISRPDLAIEYLAANLERGVYRAQAEGVPVTWEVLAAWHNQGIVSPQAIQQSSAARHYLRRAAAYRSLAEQLVSPREQHAESGL
jgi:hypothetical protein